MVLATGTHAQFQEISDQSKESSSSDPRGTVGMMPCVSHVFSSFGFWGLLKLERFW